MKLQKFLFITMLSSIVFLSCKKEKADLPTSPVAGYYQGEYSPNFDRSTYDWSMYFRNDGTVRVFTSTDTLMAIKAEGTYSLAGSVITIKFAFAGTNEAYAATGTVSSNFSKIEGTFGNFPSDSDFGSYYLNKK